MSFLLPVLSGKNICKDFICWAGNRPPCVIPAARCILPEASLQDGEGGNMVLLGQLQFCCGAGWGDPICSSNPAGELAKCFVVLLNNWKCIYSQPRDVYC